MDWAKVRVRELTENTISVSLLLEARLVVKVNDILYQNMSLTQGAKQKQHVQITAQESFFPLQSYSKKTLRKNVPKSARKYKRSVLMPPGHPIILLKSN